MSLREAIIMVEPAAIHDDPNNLKQHSAANLDHIAASITRFGFADPVGVVENPDQTVGGYLIVEGHGRLMAARKLNLEEVPILVLDLDEAQRKGYGIAHNQIQQITGMDNANVASEFDRLGVSNDDYTSLGFTEEDAMFLPQVSSSDGVQTDDRNDETRDGPTQEDGGIGVNAAMLGGYAPTIHKSSLRFASDTSYNRFLELMMQMRIKHPTAASLGERMEHLMDELGVSAGERIKEEENDEAVDA